VATAKEERSTRFVIGCLQQGLPQRSLSKAQALAWLDAEIAYWGIFAQVRELNDWTSGQSERLNITHAYTARIGTIKTQVDGGKTEALTLFMQEAAQFRVVVGQSGLGTGIADTVSHDLAGAHYLACILSLAVLNLNNSGIKQRANRDRALLVTVPSWLTATGLVSVQTREENSRVMVQAIETQAAEMQDRAERLERETKALEKRHVAFQTEIKEELESIRDIYHKHVQTEAAAIYWGKKAVRATLMGWAALIVFSAMIAVPLWQAFQNFGALKTGLLDELAKATVGGFSLTPVVAISIPVLAYAWILRHLSRLFIQNLTLADDASYRRLMTMTYLGLSKDPSSGISEAERAIILNALFRPAPPNTSEDGPPTGLLDLINKAK
jgi:hypothetical protein